MRENRSEYPPKKAAMHAQLLELPRKRRVMAIVRMEKVRASQILLLRKRLGEEVEFFSIKDKIARKALSSVEAPGVADMAEKLRGQCMLVFTEMSPFKLNVLFSKNSIMMAARAGDTASIDVVVPAKNTGIAPGPMLTEFKEAGIPTKIDQGTIWITKDTVPVRKGEQIPEKLAPLLGKMDIKPVEVGIALDSALEGGRLYSAAELRVDVEAVRSDLGRAAQEALSLSAEAGFAVPENAAQLLQKAAGQARSLSVESGFATGETREQLLQKASAQAKALASAAGYSAA